MVDAPLCSDRSPVSLISQQEDVHTTRSRGCWQGEHCLWKGCVCGVTHSSPTPVFWICCDGPCNDWYNVSPTCIGMSETKAEASAVWRCRQCATNPCRFLELSPALLYKIVQYVAPPTRRACVLSYQLASICTAMDYSIHVKQPELWYLVLREEYQHENQDHNPCAGSPRSKRRRILQQQHQETSNCSLQMVKEAHTLRCHQTDDAHVALATMAESSSMAPLTMTRLRALLSRSKILIHRRSPTGRTFLQACCAADIDEGTLLRCVRCLIEEYGADPNQWTTAESPYADRPVLFFAIARAMPSVVHYLVFSAKASVTIQVTGRLRGVSSVEKAADHAAAVVEGTFTPLSFARSLLCAEQASACLSPYWSKKLRKCIAVLSTAEGG